MILQKKLTVLVIFLTVSILVILIVWLANFNFYNQIFSDQKSDQNLVNEVISTEVSDESNTDYSTFRAKRLAALNNDLLVFFTGGQPTGDRHIICRNGNVGREQVAIGYILTNVLDDSTLSDIKQALGQESFSFSRPQKEVSTSEDGFTEFVYYGEKSGTMNITNVSDFEGSATVIEEEQFIERYRDLRSLLDSLVIEDSEMETFVDSVKFYLEKEHDFEVVDWPFSELQLSNGQSTYSLDVFKIGVPSNLQGQVITLYGQTSEKVLFMKTQNGVFKTFIDRTGENIYYSQIPEWDEQLLDFTPEQAEDIDYVVLDPNVELLEAVKKGGLENSMYYYENPENNHNIEVYQIRAAKWYSSLAELGDFCT